MRDALKIEKFLRLLFTYGASQYRTMPWRPKNFHSRTSIDPYRILVSEIMLQQTQVDRVREKYTQFIKRFPTVTTLSTASTREVLSLWSGLGYNRRALYLHACAKKVQHDFRGRFPKDFSLLCSLPGIGPSTAAGILSFAWNEPYPMIDTNIRRILKRCFPEHVQSTDKELFVFAQSIIPAGRGREWNYAMLDIGAGECTARHHRDSCPFATMHGPITEFVQRKTVRPFKETKRFLRGQILKLLVEKHTLSHTSIQKTFASSPYAVLDVLSEMRDDGLVHITKSTVSLPKEK